MKLILEVSVPVEKQFRQNVSETANF